MQSIIKNSKFKQTPIVKKTEDKRKWKVKQITHLSLELFIANRNNYMCHFSWWLILDSLVSFHNLGLSSTRIKTVELCKYLLYIQMYSFNKHWWSSSLESVWHFDKDPWKFLLQHVDFPHAWAGNQHVINIHGQSVVIYLLARLTSVSGVNSWVLVHRVSYEEKTHFGA